MPAIHTRRFILLALTTTVLTAQHSQPILEVSGAVRQPLKLTVTDLEKMPRATVRTKADGVEVNYEGVWLHEVLKQAGAPYGTDLRGKALASYVIAEAKDGYQVVFSLAEFDPVFTDNQILLADKADGKPLVGAQGPFRLVALKEKRGARSVRMLTRLDVVQLRK